MRINHKILLTLGLLAIPLNIAGNASPTSIKNSREVRKELEYYKEASTLNDLLFRENTPVHMKVVVQMLKAIDKNLLIYYPEGPFTRNDFIALAWVESEFKQYEGGTHGERGIFQIMPCEFADYNIRKNYYDIDLNTEMGFRVLNGKYKKHKDYKKAIMAYNGLVKFKSGHYSQKYWRAFEKRRIAIDLVLGHE
jgi:hypothetical protein